MHKNKTRKSDKEDLDQTLSAGFKSCADGNRNIVEQNKKMLNRSKD